MPWGLKRYQQARCLHFITFSCYRRAPFLASAEARRMFEQTLEQVRKWYGIFVAGYVVMPEHVHLLVSEPECDKLSVVIQMLKQNVAQQLKRPRPVSPKNGETRTGHPSPFWYARYYDFNVWSEVKRVEKLRYIHRNPVKRGLVQKPEDWEWSSFRHHVSGVAGIVEIESQWTARKRETHGGTARSSDRDPPCLSKERRDEDGAPFAKAESSGCILGTEDGMSKRDHAPLKMFLVPCSCGTTFAVSENYDRQGTAWSRYLKCPQCGKRHDPKNRLLQLGYDRDGYWKVDKC